MAINYGVFLKALVLESLQTKSPLRQQRAAISNTKRILTVKTGKSLVEMAQELERQSEAKKDYIADTRVLEMTPAGELALQNGSRHEFSVTDLAHNQIAQRLDIPTKY